MARRPTSRPDVNTVDPKLAPKLLPAAVVALAKVQTRREFARALECSVLLVPVDDPASTLAVWLDEIASVRGTRLEPSIGFDTIVGSAADIMSSSSGNGRTGTVFTTTIRKLPLSAGELQPRVASLLHYIVPLRKRTAGKAFSKRISVGRARGSDVVLRHGSVSKFHAWFVCDDNDVFYVSDAESKNATFVNGVRVGPGSLVGLNAGDVLRFGDISATICSAEVLWDLLVGAVAVAPAPDPFDDAPTKVF